jgi:hypothetical protein
VGYNPYREAAAATGEALKNVDIEDQTFPDATSEEVKFWEIVYNSVAGLSNTQESRVALQWANRAIINRRKTFPSNQPATTSLRQHVWTSVVHASDARCTVCGVRRWSDEVVRPCVELTTEGEKP